MGTSTKTASKRETATVFVVLLYPPVGVPRVSEIPKPPIRVPMQTFKRREQAEAALAKFLAENPEYRNWRDGSIRAETKHTPGPWTIGGPYPTISVCFIADHGSSGPEPSPPEWVPICILEGYVSRDACEANARLIAAAPDLLAALEALAPILDNESPLVAAYADCRKLVEAAIAKAGGGA